MPSRHASVYNSRAYKLGRLQVLAGNRLCHEGCGRRAEIADHQPPLSRHRHVEGSGCCALVGHCKECSRAQGGALAAENAAIARLVLGGVQDVARAAASTWTPPPDPDVERDGYPAGDPVWRVPWLKGLLRPPADASWPRLASPPHPDATGSYGAMFARFASARAGRPLRWWQKHAAARLLEHDRHGQLVWEAALLSTARQVGKSFLLRELLAWRLHQHDLFSGPQIVLHVSKDRAGAADLQGEIRRWAKDRDGYRVTGAHGFEMVEVEDTGSRWVVLARGAVYGRSAALACIDEAWDVKASEVENGIVPTLVEPPSSQLIIVSTANAAATSLVPNRRRAALELLDHPHEADLLLEWSAAPGADVYQERSWRQASPHWTPKRARTITAAANRARAGDAGDPGENPEAALKTQWLNQWIPRQRTAVPRGEALLPDGLWLSLAGDERSIGDRYTIGVEDHFGQGASVALAADLLDDRLTVAGWELDSRSEAVAQIDELLDMLGPRARVRLVAGATLLNDPAIDGLTVVAKIAGTATTARGAVAFLREAAADGRIGWDPSEGSDLLRAVDRERVVERQAGIVLAGDGRHDLVKAAAWALAEQARRVRVPAIF